MEPVGRLASRCVLFIVVFVSLASGAPARTVVVPAEGVETRVNIREEPAASSPVVGKLERNEAADLVESVPYGYRVRLFNGVAGYVSKAWSTERVLPDGTEQRLRRGAWNLKKLGHGSAKEFRAVASVLKSHFDLLGLVEVMQKGGGHPGNDPSDGGNEVAIRDEVRHVDEVLAAMASSRSGEKDLVPAGDFNLRPEALAGVTTAADQTAGTGSTRNVEGHVTVDLYDHLLLRDEVASAEFLGDARVLDVREVAVTERVFCETVSDHLPIVIEVLATGPDDD